MAVTKISYSTPKNILIGQDSYHIALGARVANTGVVADANGKKILYAGTPLKGDIAKRDTAFVKGAEDSTAVLLHDVDVTNGEENATIVLAGCIDLLKLKDETKELLTEEVKDALSRIIFVEGSVI